MDVVSCHVSQDEDRHYCGQGPSCLHYDANLASAHSDIQPCRGGLRRLHGHVDVVLIPAVVLHTASTGVFHVGSLHSPLQSVFYAGLIGACGISVLGSLLRVRLYVEEESWSDKAASSQRRVKRGLTRKLHFVFVAGILAAVGSRVASLLVLEFCLRAVSGWVARGLDTLRLLQRLMIQSQFSLGCALVCTLQFLHEGAPHRLLCSLLAAALSFWLARKASALEWHVATLYKLHSSQRYCGICITLLTYGRGPLLLPVLCGLLIVTFAVAVVAAVVIINQHFLSATEAFRLWTPLTICYSLLVVYMQDGQHDLPANQALLISVAVRLGALMVLMLTVGRWADVLHILVCFLGEASCLIPATDLLNATSSQE